MALDPADVAMAAELSGVSPQELANELDNAEQREMMRGDDEERAAIREETQRKAEKRIRREYATHQGVSEQELQNEADVVNAVDMMRGGDDDDKERARARRRAELQDEEREQLEYEEHERAQVMEDRARSAALKRGAESEGEGDVSKISRVDTSKKRDKLPLDEEHRKKRSARTEDTPMPHAPPQDTAFGERAPREQRKKKRDEGRKKRMEGKLGKQEKQEAPGLDALVKAADKAGMEVVDIKVEPPHHPATPSDMEIPFTVEIPKPPVIHVVPPKPKSDSAPPPEVPDFIFVRPPLPPAPAHTPIPAPPIIAPPTVTPQKEQHSKKKNKKEVKFATGADDDTMPAVPPTTLAPPAPTASAPPAAAPSSSDTRMPEVPAFGPITLDQHIRNHPASKTSRGTPVVRPPSPTPTPVPTLAVAPPVKLIQKHHQPHINKRLTPNKATRRPTHSPASTYEKVDWEEKRRTAEAQIKAYDEKMKLLKQESEMAAQPTRPPAAAAAVHSQPSEEYPHHHRHNQLVVVHNPRRGWVGDDDEGMPEVPGHMPRVVTTTTTKSY